MALDGAFLYAVTRELDFLVGGRVDKIHQPSREEVIISIRTRGGNYKLLISASANNARVHITNVIIDNPKAPPMFCMLLRKHLGGGRLIAIRQDGLERILYLDFECMNELGDMVMVTLACEIMGRYSNLVIINEQGKIIDSIKRVDSEMSRERMVLPGMTYTFPPRDDRISFLSATENEMRERIRLQKSQELSKSLIKVFEGVSPILTREWAFYATKGIEILNTEMSSDTMDRLIFKISQTKQSLMTGENKYTIVKTKEGMLKDFSFIPILQYGSMMVTKEFSSAFDTLDSFYSERDSFSRLKQRANDLFKLLVNTSERISKRIVNQKEELDECKKKDNLKLMGDLLSSNIYRVQKGDEKAVLENFYAENCPQIEIALDKRLSPSQNTQRYYGEYRKLVTAEKKLAEQIELGEEELQYIDSVFDALNRAEIENEVIELRLELAEQGYIRANKLKGKPPKALPPLEFTSTEGYKILVGRNNKQNDKLTLKTAEKWDIWLHTRNIAGSHVIIVTNGQIPSDKTIEEAGFLAVRYSKARNSTQVPVDYTLVRYVKKPVAAKPGKVIFSNEKTIYISPNIDQ